ncbi:MAG: hypothetical protein ABI543_05560 [Ignavibacteria bacterium]
MKHSVSSQKSGQNANMEQKKANMVHNNAEHNENISLEHHLKQVKQEDYSGTFPKVENWLYKAGIQLTNQNQLNERKLQKMKNFFFAHKLRLVYTIVALLLVIGACNMPVTQTESAGKMITMVVPSDNTGFLEKMNALPWMKNAQVTSNENTNNGLKQTLYRIVLPNTTDEQVKNYCKELESIGEVSTIRITGMDYDVKRPLYSAALDNFFSINIDATGMSDEEVQNEVERKLKEQGVDMKLKFKTTPEGRKEIFMEKSDNDKLKEPQTFGINIENDNGKENIRLMTKKADPHQFDGKTDTEIREMVRKDLDKPGLKDSEIIIERNADEVKVKVERNEKEIK